MNRARIARSAVRVLLPPLAVAVGLAVAVQFDGPRRWLVILGDPSSRLTSEAAAAESVRPLDGVFDGRDADRPQVPVRLEPRLTGVPQPTDVAFVPGRADRVVVLSKLGTAHLCALGADGTGSCAPWFTIDVATKSELGLLGIAFDPKFADNGLFYVDATPTRPSGDATVISRWRVDPRTLERPSQQRVLLEVAQPYANHDAGQLAFGPDGMLYIGFGDGGFRGDPHGNGQNLGTLLGAMLRIDVRAETFRVPLDNPFLDRDGIRPEIWAYGLRNPWRFSFDSRGRLIVGDVGQDRIEEVDVVGRGDNLGWNVREADACYPPSVGDCASDGLLPPVWSYERDEGASVTGGVEWTAPGPLAGRYILGDYATGRLWALVIPDGAPATGRAQPTALGRFDLSPSAFARTPDGAVWVADLRRGAVFALVVTEGALSPRPAGAP